MVHFEIGVRVGKRFGQVFDDELAHAPLGHDSGKTRGAGFRADRLALAMESRCYRGGIKRTAFRELKFNSSDLYTGLAVLATIAAVLALPFLVPF